MCGKKIYNYGKNQKIFCFFFRYSTEYLIVLEGGKERKKTQKKTSEKMFNRRSLLVFKTISMHEKIYKTRNESAA